MRKILLLVCLSLTANILKAQYTTIYENSFRNWLPGQDWVMINNDTITQQPGLLDEHYLTEVYNYMLGCPPLSGLADKIMITPVFVLGNDPHLLVYTNHDAASQYSVWVVANENDTTINGLTDSLGLLNVNGFNHYDLNNFSNDTVRIAFRLRGTNARGYIDNIKLLNKNSLAYIPDSCFRSYLMTVVPGAFTGDSLDYLDSLILSTTQLVHQNSCIESLDGLQFFPFLKNIDFSSNTISYIPPEPLHYMESMKIKNNFLTYIPFVPRCTYLDFENNLVNRIPDFFNQYVQFLHARNNLIYDCLPGSNRFVDGDMCGNLSVNFGGYFYYTMGCRSSYPALPSVCSQSTGYVAGVVYYDMNQNGVRDTLDMLLTNQRVNFLQGPDLITNSNGEYSVALTPGYVNMNVTQLPSYFSCANPLADSLSEQQSINHDFRIEATTQANDLSIRVNSTGTTRVGELLTLNLTVRNLGTTSSTGTAKMLIPAGYTFVSLSDGTIVNDTLIWTTTVTPFGNSNNALQIIINSYPVNQATRFRGMVSTSGDVNLANNKDSVNVFILPTIATESPWDGIPQQGFPFDPNNKLVSTPRVPDGFNGYLTYNINFENIGTANATRVMVRDSLGPQFDYSSFELIATSHPCIVSLGSDSLLQFLFQPIALTPTSSDSLNSHGHIWFKIKPSSPVQFGDTLRNHASIYFDNQPAVITDVCKVWAVNHSAFTSAVNVICAGGNVQFTGQSTGTPTSLEWWFPGGTPSTSTAQNPLISYSSSGIYDVALISSWGTEIDTLYVEGFVTVNANPAALITPSSSTTLCQGDSVTLTVTAASNYLWSNSSASQSITVSASGNYLVTVTDANNCSASASLNVTVNPLPIASITPNGPTTFCVGDSVALMASGASNYLWSNNSTSQSINVTSSGNYFVTITDANNCSASTSVNVTVNSLPVTSITPNGPTTFCQGDSVLLTASGANNYLWSNSSASQSISVTSSGNYFVTATDGNNCSASTSLSVTVNPLPTATITPSGPTTFCAGDSVELTSSVASNYLWSTNATTQSINVNSSGSYSVTVTDGNNCSSVSPATTVIVNSNPPTPNITQVFDSLFSDLAIGYQWYFNNVLILGATLQSYYPTQNGNYSVVITDLNGCTASSVNYLFVATKIREGKEMNEIMIAPNPVKERLYVINHTLYNINEVEIFDVLGKRIFREHPTATSQQLIILDVSDFNPGIYFVKVKNEKGMILMKFVKQVE